MKERTAILIGHRDCFGLEEECVISALKQLIAQGVTDFLCGGQGNFDYLCARCIHQLRADFPGIACQLVIPYPDFAIPSPELFDEVIYPGGLESLHRKAAIPARNRYMVLHAGYALCYIRRGWGGAARTFALAQRQGLHLLQL